MKQKTNEHLSSAIHEWNVIKSQKTYHSIFLYTQRIDDKLNHPNGGGGRRCRDWQLMHTT